jgi:hypothetical protein
MLSNNFVDITEEEIEEYYSQIIKVFEKVEGFDIDDYYGVAIMSIKKNDSFQIRLQYDYEKKAINGNPIEIENIEKAMFIYYILTTKRKPRTAVKRIDLIFKEPRKRSDSNKVKF